MANYIAHHVFEYVDVNGDTAVVRVPQQMPDSRTLAIAATANAAIGSAITACTNAKNIKRSFTVLLDEAQLIVGTTPPTNAEYSSVTDGAKLQFSNNLGDRYSLTVPAPLESDFGASSNVVDSTNANVAALITTITADATTSSGAALNLYKGGIKVGKRARRRRSSLVP